MRYSPSSDCGAQSRYLKHQSKEVTSIRISFWTSRGIVQFSFINKMPKHFMNLSSLDPQAVEGGRDTQAVVSELFASMETHVNAFGAGALKVTRRIEGTAFFPGGIGLWRTTVPFGVAPRYFPQRPIMILGHNFDKVAGLEASYRRGIELMDGPT
jgi:hypothetical protein